MIPRLPLLAVLLAAAGCASRPQVHDYHVRAVPVGDRPVTVSGTVRFGEVETPVAARALPVEFAGTTGPVLVDLACDDAAGRMQLELTFMIDKHQARPLTSLEPARRLAVVEERHGDDFSLRIEPRQ